MSLYSINDKVLSPAKAQKYMDPGVHENVELIDVKVVTTDNGNDFIAYYWRNSLDQQVSKTEYAVKTTGKKPVASLDEKELKIYTDMVSNQMRRITYVAKQFVPKEELEAEFDTYKDFCNFIKSKLTPDKYQGVKLRLKVAIDKNGWCTVPSYVRETTNPWIERMDTVSSADSKIQMDPTVDRTTRDSKDNRTSSKVNPLLIDDGTDIQIPTVPVYNVGVFEEATVAPAAVVTPPATAENDDLPF